MSGARKGKIVITRAMGQAQDFARHILSGIEGTDSNDLLFEPLLVIKMNDGVHFPYFGAYACVIISSVHGCDILPHNEDGASYQFYCVGVATAEALMEKGYHPSVVMQNMKDLLEVISARHSGLSERMLYLRGRDVSLDLNASLAGGGHVLDEVEVYQAELSDGFGAAFLLALKGGEVDIITFFSRRTAAHFARMVDEMGISHILSGINALCMSDAVVECLHSAFNGNCLVAETPDMSGMVDALKQYVENQ